MLLWEIISQIIITVPNIENPTFYYIGTLDPLGEYSALRPYMHTALLQTRKETQAVSVLASGLEFRYLECLELKTDGLGGLGAYGFRVKGLNKLETGGPMGVRALCRPYLSSLL